MVLLFMGFHSQPRTPIFLTGVGIVALAVCVLNSKHYLRISDSLNIAEAQDPERNKKVALAEGYDLRDKLDYLVDKDKNRILDVKERRSLLDLLGYEKTFLNDVDPLSLRPTIDGDRRLNIYLSQGFDGYVGTIGYSQVEELLKNQKKK